TDEPAELVEVRPDLHFPPGLQQVLDAALARSPVDRYQSAAKLAHDLAAVAGLSRAAGGAARPATLTDGDDKTELIEPERATRRIDVTRARDVLDDLLLNKLDPRSAAMVLDSAMHIFNAPGIASSDKAYAAFVVGNAYFQQFNRRRGCDWVRTATVLSPTDTTYPKILARC